MPHLFFDEPAPYVMYETLEHAPGTRRPVGRGFLVYRVKESKHLTYADGSPVRTKSLVNTAFGLDAHLVALRAQRVAFEIAEYVVWCTAMRDKYGKCPHKDRAAFTDQISDQMRRDIAAQVQRARARG